MKNIILTSLFIFISTFVLFLSLRGLPGNPTENDLQSLQWKDNGPLELSPDRGRFALLYSFVENKSLTFDVPLARFATPDVAVRPDGKYVSLFAPAVSFLVIPGYIIGKFFGASQVGAYAVIALIAIINALLIRAIALRLKASPAAATIGGFLFLFATPAFSYAVNLYQHHISTLLILLSIYCLLRFRGFVSLCIVWFLLATSISVDYPNAVFMIPIALYALMRIISFSKEDGKNFIILKPFYVFSFLAVLPTLLFYMWFSQASYGSPFQFSGTLQSVQVIDGNGKPALAKDAIKPASDSRKPEEEKQKTAVGFFETRNLVHGFYTDFVSSERGVFWFTPVILLGFLGAIVLYKSKGTENALLLGVIGFNVLLYTMWGDPWGGWAFGSRYLIPSFALMAVLLAIGISSQRGRRRIIISLLCIVLAIYSLMVNTLGALTTNRIPPKVEADALSQQSKRIEKYSYDRDIDFLMSNNSKSFVWQSYASQFVDAQAYYWIIVAILGLSTISLFSYLLFFEKQKS